MDSDTRHHRRLLRQAMVVGRRGRETAAFLKPHGYGFYLYAPKFDLFLRERWAEDHPPINSTH